MALYGVFITYIYVMLILRSLQAFFRSVQYETNHRIKLLLIIRFFCKKYQIKGIAVLNIFMLEKM